MPPQLNAAQLLRLRDMINQYHNKEEFADLCFGLAGVELKNLAGEALKGKIRSLLEQLVSEHRLDELKLLLQKQRPHVSWARYFLPDETIEEPPYKGLQVFDEEDAHLFFGREALTNELIQHLNEHRFLAIIGASGSGKSSVARAGLIPAVRRGAVKYQGGASDSWPIHIIKPGDEPLKALAATLTRGSESVTAMKTLLADLRVDSESLDLYLFRQLEAQPDGRLLLVVDQFEELFTQCDDEEERRLFVENLVQAVQSGKQGRLTLVLTLRADFYAQALRYEGLVPLLENQQKIVESMKQDELREAMEKPLAATPYHFQLGLIDTILQDVGREPGALPLLSHALLATWRRREGDELTLSGYRVAGGVRGAIAQTAERVYLDQDEEKQQLIRNIFLRLTELGEGTEDTRRRAEMVELLPDNGQREIAQQLLSELADERLVTTNEAQAEVAHEALIREWPRLRNWLDEDRDGLRLHRQLTEAAQLWVNYKRDESYLYRGGRLEEVKVWGAENEGMLSEQERVFIAAGLQAETAAQAEREAEQQRKLAQAQELAEQAEARRQAEAERAEEAEARERAERERAEVQTKSAQRNRRLVWWLSAVLLSALAFAFVAVTQLRLAQARRLTAEGELQFNQGNGRLAILLGLESDRIRQTEENERLLRRIPYADFFIPKAIFSDNMGRARSVAWGPNGELAIGSDDGTVRVWDVVSGEEVAQLTGHRASVLSVAWGPNGELASGSGDGTVRVWDVGSGEEVTQLTGHTDGVWSVAWGPNGELASGSWDTTVRVWDVVSGEEVAQLTGHTDWVLSVAWGPNGELASGSWDATVRVWDVVSGEEVAQLTGNTTGWVLSVAWGPNGELAIGSGDGTVRVWDVGSGEEVTQLTGHADVVRSVAWGPNGELASGSDDETVRVWDVGSGEEVTQLTGHADVVRSVAWGPNGELASGSDDETVRVWDVGSGEEVTQLTGHADVVRSVAWGPNGELVSGSDDGTVRVWDVVSGEEVTQLTGHTDGVLSVAWGPNGELASGSGDRTIFILQNTRARSLCDQAKSNLSEGEWRQYVGLLWTYQATCPEEPMPEIQSGLLTWSGRAIMSGGVLIALLLVFLFFRLIQRFFKRWQNKRVRTTA